jgi:hypothetical protein
MQAKLDEAVANGRITQQQADDAIAKLNDRLDDIVNRTPGEDQPAE